MKNGVNGSLIAAIIMGLLAIAMLIIGCVGCSAL